MRQSGILAAAALHALEHHRRRLTDDHANATRLADGLREIRGLTIPLPVETNMVFVDVDAKAGTAADLVSRLRARGVWMLATGPQRVRAVCHLDVDRSGIERAIAAARECCGAGNLVHA